MEDALSTSAPEDVPTPSHNDLAELRAAIVALDLAIAKLRRHIADLQTDIADLETQNGARAQEIDRLVADIEERKREVEEQYERDRKNALLLCALGYCNVGVVSLVMAYDNDERLKQLTKQLEQAKAQQATIHEELADYQQDKALLDAKLSKLRRTEGILVELLGAAETGTDLQKTARRADRMGKLRENLGEQAKTLGEVKGLATSLAPVIDEALTKVAVAAEKADRLAEASRKAAYKLLEIVAAGSPDAAAKKWLDQWVAKKTKELLKDLGWDPDGFVENLIARAFPGQEKTPAAQELKKRILAAIRNA